MAKKIAKPVKGYKIFHLDNLNNHTSMARCRDYTFGSLTGMLKHHTISGNPELCSRGFHFCEKLIDCFEYYSFANKSHVICKVEAHDLITHKNGNNKRATNNLKIVKVLSLSEIKAIVTKELENCSSVKVIEGTIKAPLEYEWKLGRNVRQYQAYTKNEGTFTIPKAYQHVANIGCTVSIQITRQTTNPFKRFTAKSADYISSTDFDEIEKCKVL